MNPRPVTQTTEVGRVTPCAPSSIKCGDGAQGVTRPTLKFIANVPSKLCFQLATKADDADIRRLLRENPMAGQIAISLEREPDYFADARLPGTEKQTIIAREGGRIVCAGSCGIRQSFINGQPRRVGYLGGLRLDAHASGRFDILRRGYQFFRELQADAPADFYFTSIASDNVRARNFLERGLKGMPGYEFAGEFVTVLLPVKNIRGSRREEALTLFRVPNSPFSVSKMSAPTNKVIDCLNEHARRYQLAPCWSGDELFALSPLGLSVENFRSVTDGGKIVACAALWDQRGFKQTVICGYAPCLAAARPVMNFVARFSSQPRLPAVGATLAHAFVSHLAVAAEKRDALLSLIEELQTLAVKRGIEFLTLGFAANDPRLATLRASFRGREYRSRIYVVRWPRIGGGANDLDGRCLHPEIALL